MAKTNKKREKTNGIGSVIWGLLEIAFGGFFVYAATTAGSIGTAVSLLIIGAPFIALGALYISSTRLSRVKKILDALPSISTLFGDLS